MIDLLASGIVIVAGLIVVAIVRRSAERQVQMGFDEFYQALTAIEAKRLRHIQLGPDGVRK